MQFEWDDKKNQLNQKKHGIDFAAAALVFLDRDRIEAIDGRKEYGEVRYQTIGVVNNNLLYIVYTKREENYRIISARRANRDEREAYLYHRQITER